MMNKSPGGMRVLNKCQKLCEIICNLIFAFVKCVSEIFVVFIIFNLSLQLKLMWQLFFMCVQ